MSGERLAKRLGDISRIGLTEDYGSLRRGFSKEERQVKNMIIEWMKEAGLQVQEDGAGNVFGRLEGQQTNAPVIMSGSHVDSVPHGGHFDGPLGVLAALEVAQAWHDTHYLPRKTFEVAIFSDEEGARFNSTLTGSQAMTSGHHREDLSSLTDHQGLTFLEVINKAGLNEEDFFNTKRDLSEIESYVEVHIEQGKILEKENLPTGIVTGIAGPYWLKISFKGEAGHAGNTPMNDRQDALVGASELIQAISEIPQTISDTAVATVGKIEVQPNGVNVIPGQVDLFIDVRDIHEKSRQQVVDKIVEKGQAIANQRSIEWIRHEVYFETPPMLVGQELQERLAKASQEVGIRPFYLASGAGHDAMNLGRLVPSAMIFVRSKNGISHNPKEWSDLDDCVQAVHLLKRYLENLQ